jgi:hypothetical protein
MAKDKIQDLRHHLFAQLERLSDDQSMKNPLIRERETERAKAITEVSQAIINSAKVEIDYLKALSVAGANGLKPEFLGIEQKK